MSIENISVSIDSSPIRNFIKTVLREELQPTLYGHDNTIATIVNDEIENSPTIKERIENLVENRINYREIAENIDAEDVASHISPSRVAAYMNSSDIANEISVSDVAEEMAERIQSDLDYTEIAHNIQLADLASEIDVETLMDKIDYRKLAKALLSEFAAAKTNA